MKIDAIMNGYVIDHITAGNGMKIYNLLGLDKLECSIAIIKNVPSGKMSKKDIIKIDAEIELNMDILGFVDPGITINVIKNGVRTEKKFPALPETLTNVIKCKNPRCISGTEQELPHIFKLTDKETRTYRCIYCEVKGKR